jgi:uncharacterized protein YndB with AHSA1/START domain
MANIRHLLTINAPASKVYVAITEQKGLSSWWTPATKAESKVNSVAEFGFGGGYVKKMKITNLEPGKKVEWECTEAHPEWIGTTISFGLEEKDGKTVLKFSHDGWNQETDMFAICNFNWGKFMQSLQSYVETGQGEPYKMPEMQGSN